MENVTHIKSGLTINVVTSLKIKKKSIFNVNIKRGKDVLTFGDIEIEKHKFYQYDSPIFLKDRDIDNVLVPNNILTKKL